MGKLLQFRLKKPQDYDNIEQQDTGEVLARILANLARINQMMKEIKSVKKSPSNSRHTQTLPRPKSLRPNDKGGK